MEKAGGKPSKREQIPEMCPSREGGLSSPTLNAKRLMVVAKFDPYKIWQKWSPEKNGGKPSKREQIPEMCP